VARRSGGVADVRDVYQFVAPGKRLMTREISTDNGAHWTEITQSVATKMS
jgi:hypothetical protein